MIKKIKDLNINYIQYGDGKDIVLLHGWGQNIKMMDPLGKNLYDNFRITILDFPGFGSSETPNFAYTINDYTELVERFDGSDHYKKKFGVSTQHYSFAVKAFVEMVKDNDTSRYELAIRETRTQEVISDVANLRSEIGIIYLSDFNRRAIGKLLRTANLEFHPLINCDAYVYLWSGHPLASRSSISFEDLKDYPCLSFEQGDSSFYYTEEILSTKDYSRIIKACDRATMLNLMVGLNGYTLCSGIICEELNGGEFLAIHFESDDSESKMEIGYITRKNTVPSRLGKLYIEKINEYLRN
ncbi:MAG: LysR family transcriptional regulator [Clostridiales bacterium]|nr:LysR family transcriptional regulator [Clostridiales bacterium]